MMKVTLFLKQPSYNMFNCQNQFQQKCFNTDTHKACLIFPLTLLYSERPNYKFGLSECNRVKSIPPLAGFKSREPDKKS